MDIVYARFTVSITETEYGWQDKKRGEAVLTMRAPRVVLDELDASGLFMGALRGALAEFDGLDAFESEDPVAEDLPPVESPDWEGLSLDKGPKAEGLTGVGSNA